MPNQQHNNTSFYPRGSMGRDQYAMLQKTSSVPHPTLYPPFPMPVLPPPAMPIGSVLVPPPCAVLSTSASRRRPASAPIADPASVVTPIYPPLVAPVPDKPSRAASPAPASAFAPPPQPAINNTRD